jgi:hypothetical protein
MRTRRGRHPKRGPVRQQQGFEPPPPRRAGSMRAVSLRLGRGGSQGGPQRGGHHRRPRLLLAGQKAAVKSRRSLGPPYQSFVLLRYQLRRPLGFRNRFASRFKGASLRGIAYNLPSLAHGLPCRNAMARAYAGWASGAKLALT